MDRVSAREGLDEARSVERKNLQENGEKLRRLEKLRKYSISRSDRKMIEEKMAQVDRSSRDTERLYKRSEHDRLLHRWEIMNRKEKQSS